MDLVAEDRASRFLWTLEWGKKDQKLFEKAIQTREPIIQESENLTLLIDGERRYGNSLNQCQSEA